MNSLQVNYFLAVAEGGSITEAAKKLYVSQPAVSKQIAGMENELGVVLFDRAHDGVHLTQAGELFYRHFSKVVQNFNKVLSAARSLEPERKMELNFGVVEDWDVSGFIPQAVGRVKNRWPGLDIHLASRDSVKIFKSLLSNELDIILYSPMFMDEKDAEGLEEVPVAEAKMIVLFSAMHRLAGKPDLCFRDFKDEPLLLCSRDANAVIDRVVRFCSFWGFAPKLETCERREDLFLNLQTGRGFTLFHELVRSKGNPAFRYIIPETPPECDMRQELCLYYKKDNSNPALPIVINEIKSIL